MTSLVGAEKTISPVKVKKARARISQDVEQHMSSRRPIVDDTKIKPFTPATYKGKDPREVKQWIEGMGKLVPLKVTDMIEKNKVGQAESGAKIAQQEMGNLMERAKGGDIQPQELNDLKRMVSGMEKGKDRDDMIEEIDVAEDMMVINDIFEQPQLSERDDQKIVGIELDNVQGNTKLEGRKEKIRKDVEITNGINDILAKLETVQDKMLSGFGAEYMVSGAAKDLSTMEALIAKANGKNINREALIESIGMNTEIGRLVSEFVKYISGASVTNEEYGRLSLIIAGAKAGDPGAMAKAMQTFRDGTVRQLDRESQDPVVKYRLPKTAYGLKSINDQIDYGDRITSSGIKVWGDQTKPHEAPTTTPSGQQQTPDQQNRMKQFQQLIGGS